MGGSGDNGRAADLARRTAPRLSLRRRQIRSASYTGGFGRRQHLLGFSGGLMASDEHGVLRRLVDKDEIVDLVHRYSYCVDLRLYDEVAELFTEDCVVDYGPAFAPP